MSSKTIVLITGANTGLGFEMVKALVTSKLPYHIIIGARSSEKADQAISEAKKHAPGSISELSSVLVDVQDDKTIESAAKEVEEKFGRLDALVNNAGASYDGEIMKGTMSLRDAWARSFDINVTGTYCMTHAFISLLLKSSNPRLLFVTSGTSSLEEAVQGLPSTLPKVPAGWPKPKGFNFTSYRSSKAATNMMMCEWTRILKEDNVKIWGVSPGFLATGLGGAGAEALKKLGAEDPALGGNFVRDILEGKRDEDVNKVIRRNEIQSW